MKKLIYTFLILSLIIGSFSCSGDKTLSLTDSNKAAIKGSWMILEKNGVPVDIKQLKHYTDQYFIWHIMGMSDTIKVAAAGKYTIEGDNLREFVEMTTPTGIYLKGNTAQIKIKISNDTLFQSTVLPTSVKKLEFTEMWVRTK